VRFYDLFDTPDRIGPWLTQISWRDPWPASHLVWGGPVFWSSSARATPEWWAACDAWFVDHLDDYGSWPRDLVGPAGGEISPLGCAVHVWPLYRHRGLPVPGLERLAEWTLRWQKPEGHWDKVGGYGTMDALYALCLAVEAGLDTSGAYRAAAERYLAPHLAVIDTGWSGQNAHQVLGWASCVGYLQRLLPDRLVGPIRWGDIFDRAEIYDLDAVEARP